MRAASKGRLLAVGVGALLLAVAVAAGRALVDDVRPVRPGSRAPGFSAVNVATGDTVSLADFEGSVLLLNFWATYCLPCEQEMPSMQRLHELLSPHGLTVVAVSLDDEDSDFVLQWVRERGLTFHVLHDRTGSSARAYQLTGWPESFVIDREGVIVKKAWGAKEWDSPAEASLFGRLLGLAQTPPGS